jgi:putative PIN family toxin of toxin-antitoxin system
MAQRPDLIVLDTNLWISFLLNKSLGELEILLFNDLAKLVFSEELLSEFLEVSKRPKIRKYISAKDLNDIIKAINEYSNFFEVGVIEKICRDPKDDFLLALAKTSKADYLLTGDKDLLILDKIGDTQITTLTDYLSISKKSS